MDIGFIRTLIHKKIIKVAAEEVLNDLGIDDPVLDIAKGLAEAALNDEYTKSRNLYPNVDFYSGIIYRALGIPVEMFTAMFAIGRLPGWIAQWKEMRTNNEPSDQDNCMLVLLKGLLKF